jgi:hypothetical protein
MTVKLEELERGSDHAPAELFLSPDAVPRRQNRMLAVGLVFVADPHFPEWLGAQLA